MSDNEIIEAARSIRPYLRSLLGDNRGPTVDAELGTLLDESREGRPVTGPLQELLTASTSTANWLERFAEWDVPPEIVEQRKNLVGRYQVAAGGDGEAAGGYEPGAGDIGDIKGDVYTCPQGNYTWYASSSGQAPPPCPYDGSTLNYAGRR
jgi:hypothetical protein